MLTLLLDMRISKTMVFSMTNKQPFYHEVHFLFTATRELSEQELEELVQTIKHKDIVKGSVQVDWYDAEPGDPADLL